MSKYELPELPPRFRWGRNGAHGQVELEAFNTKWVGDGEWEKLGYLVTVGGAIQTMIWKLRIDGSGRFHKQEGEVASLEEGAKYLWTLVQLGEADFTFLESEDGTEDTGSS